MLRNNFPETKEDAAKYGVEIRDTKGVYKIFEHNETIEKTFNDVNDFLEKSGYEKIALVEFLDNENSYESDDEIVSLNLHGYIEALVLNIEKEN